MSIHNLTDRNFQVVGHNRKTLNINLPGNVLVFFKMDGCKGCGAFEPLFYQLSREDQRASYAIVNLSNARNVINMSRATGTPIQAVPYILLYVNGSPLARYKGNKNLPSLKAFITKVLRHAPPAQQSHQGFMPQQAQDGHQRGMYGNGGYSHPPMGPQQGHAGYSQQAQHGKIHMPEIGNAPNMQGVIKGGQTSQYAYLNDMEEEDEERLLLPGQVTPHNVPWESAYKKMGTLD